MAGSRDELNGANEGLALDVQAERWPIRGRFAIARGYKREAHVIVTKIGDGRHTGRGECVPYARYGETVEGVLGDIEGCRTALARGLTREELAVRLPAGAGRNAIDCALWDLEAKRSDTPAATAAGLSALQPVATAFTISLADPDIMAAYAARASMHPLLKLKLGGAGDADRLQAVRASVPQARLIADANEAWQPHETESLLACCAEMGVELIEQPLPADNDELLAEIARPIPVCADESAHDSTSLAPLTGRYDAVNIKLDKTGGLTEAFATAAHARDLGLKIMVGSMVATSLAMAPALLVAQDADWVDLDGPLLLERDRTEGLTYRDGMVFPPAPALWG